MLDAAYFINYIRSHRLVNFKLVEEENSRRTTARLYSDDNVTWEKFFSTCPDLRHLYMQSFDLNMDFVACNLNLTSLGISGYYKRDHDEFFEVNGHYTNYKFIDQIKLLIRAQKDTLKKVSFTVAMQEDPDILNFLLYEMKLEELNWIYDKRQALNERVWKCENFTLKKLKIKLKNGISERFLDVLRTLKGVEAFDVDSQYQKNPSWSELLRFLHYYMPSVRTLTMRNPFYVENHEISEKETKLHQVETLIIHGFPKQPEQREKLLMCAPNIRKLVIKGKHWSFFDKLTADELKIVLKLRNLEEFEFRGVIEVDEEVLELIKLSKVRCITVEYQQIKLEEVSAVGEVLKAANERLVVIKRQVTTANFSDNELDEVGNLFHLPVQY